jgi:histone acetyltransferase (RNA polymerase elongator complex component)
MEAKMEAISVKDIEDYAPQPRNFIDNPKYKIVIHKLLDTRINSQDEMNKFLRLTQREVHLELKPNILLYVYRRMITENEIKRSMVHEQFMISKAMRGTSGVMVVTVVTSPWPDTAEKDYGAGVEAPANKQNAFYKNTKTEEFAKKYKTFSCKFDCYFCPSEPGQPKSYIKMEPAVARANQHRFDPVEQFRDRGTSYIVNGHQFDKVELIVLGGTWSSYPKDYQEGFIRDIYYAANTFYQKNPRPRLSVEEEIKLNEDSFCRIIGLTLETRPDQINIEELIRFRRFGVTRIQLGIQHIDDEILKYIGRGCTNLDAIRAIKLCKDAGFKVDGHFMPDLPESSPEIDRILFEYILNSPDLQVDQMKIYPCAVVPWTRIAKWHENYKNGYDTVRNPDNLSSIDNRKYKPYAEDIYDGIKIKVGKTNEINSGPLIELLIAFKSQIHPWIRINRLVRDIPGLYISGGNDREDLRDVLHREMKTRGLSCKCIRCREVKNKKTDVQSAQLVIRKYNASGGIEYFISYESPDRQILYGFLRLRITPDSGIVFPELADTALIRELHVYGTVIRVAGVNETQSAQHIGFGKKLVRKAEELSYWLGYKRISVIAGVGVRNYYRKQGYLDSLGLGNFQIKTMTGYDCVGFNIESQQQISIRPRKPTMLSPKFWTLRILKLIAVIAILTWVLSKRLFPYFMTPEN